MCVYELCTFGTCAHVHGVLHAIMNLRKSEEDINCIGLSVSDLFLCPFKIRCSLTWSKAGNQQASGTLLSFFLFCMYCELTNAHVTISSIYVEAKLSFHVFCGKILNHWAIFLTDDVFAGSCMQVLSKTDNAFNHRVMSLT